MGAAKEDLLRALRENRDETCATLASVTEASLAEGRYENGWNGLQILAHVAAIEWTYPRLLDLARGNDAGRGDAGGAPAREARGGMDGYNSRQVERRAGATAAELIEEWGRNRDALIAAVEAEDAALFERPVRSAGGVTGNVAAVVRSVAIDHVRGHVRDLMGDKAGRD
ncbi:MAG: DinB family protein [Dehalococcoidia bacterium]